MNSIYLCFCLKSVSTNVESNDFFEKNYQTIYKPLIKFLYNNSSFPFSFSFSGSQLSFYKKRKNELLQILHELVNRKQIEAIGGNFYDALLPIIYPVDRNSQIDLLSAEIRQTTGKRPRGMFLFEDCWDPALINSIHTCGIEYVLLEKSLLSENKQKYLPIVVSDLSKSIDILPYYDDLKPNKETTPKEFIDNITKTIHKIETKDQYFQFEPERIVTICFTQDEIVNLINSKWFEKLLDYLKNNPNTRIKLSTPYHYIKNKETEIPGFVPSGISEKVSNRILRKQQQNTKTKPKYSIYDFMENTPASHRLCNRMLYISMLVNQYKNDKMRKKAAREKLWEAQSGISLLGTLDEPYLNTISRQNAYKSLIEAENFLREEGKTKESITCFDYNVDGLNEYVCRMENYFAYISLVSGSVQEFDVFKTKCNYVDNILRNSEYDGYSDDYQRGMFIDHFFTNDQFKKYINNEPAGSGVFSKIRYKEINYSQTHHEIYLSANAIWTPTKQSIYLRKKIIINSTGMYVQYIIKNESNKKLNAKFAVESNLTHINFIPENINYYNVEVVDNGQKIDIESNKNTKKLVDKNKLLNTQLVRISDNENGMSFVFEPNEKSGYSYSPLFIKRPSNDYKKISEASLIYVSTIFWDLEIEPGMETEKSINFTIVPVKKIKEKK